MFLKEPSHILILLIVVLVLFGAKRLPDSARSLGRSMRIFKSEMKEMTTDEKKTEDDSKPEK
ncbi:MAG: twin-arginine translocase TatA/TatE family subunit [Streptomycetaceae bacterium]|jgi:sec-independent protein translocase protein TatA|nr:MAG: twin-arginine translocase TatA/TatE family subunit [Streptomycetaceae bacterium]